MTINCPVCHTENHHLAVTCNVCGGFVQGRVDNLDLFQTAGWIIERPRRAFMAISMARHKNYAMLLSAISGIGLTFMLLRLFSAGDRVESILNLLAVGFLFGPPFGMFITLLLSLILLAMAVLMKHPAGFRNTWAVSAYACLPLVGAALFLLPVELMTFGRYFFTQNPSPALLKPLSYYLLVALESASGIWCIFLLITGLRTLLDTSVLRAAMFGVFALILAGGTTLGVLRIFLFHP